MNIQNLIRKNILSMKPYSSARDEFSGEAMVFLDANENPFNQPYNRYPDPLQRELKARIAQIRDVAADSIFLGNGSDEPIDLLVRAFCEPGRDNILQMEPTYGMYQVAASIHDVDVVKVPLHADFSLDADAILRSANSTSKLVFLCSPNNPTGNSLDSDSVLRILREFQGMVVVDEAYIDFDPDNSLLPRLSEFENLVILQTLSKAWGMAGIRLGMAFASPYVIGILNKIKYPYNINMLTQQKALELLENTGEKDRWVKTLLQERSMLAMKLKEISYVRKVWPSDANFILVTMKNARKTYEYLVDQGIIVRDRSRILLCEESLRITVGSESENEALLSALMNFENK